MGAVRLCGLYLPNGNPAPGPKYDYKLAWMDRMRAHAAALLETEMPVVLAGDYNVIPLDEDAAHPERGARMRWRCPESRAAFRRLLNLGYTEAIRARTAAKGLYSFWDYQAGAWDRDNGIRIDHLLLSPQAADLMRDAGIDRHVRGRENRRITCRSGSIWRPEGGFPSFLDRRLRRRRCSHWGRRLRRRPGRGGCLPPRAPPTVFLER
jgi:exodeoxyribonuclease-3